MYVDQSCYGWPLEELSDNGDFGEISVSQILDHGSISFGRFALEPLSWEKRSVFTHNRYQEELEKLRAPGLVAQKKAYFEEYYKKIRTMKALQENQNIEPPSYCGDSSDISAQIMEDDRRVVPSECHEDIMPKSILPSIETTSTEETLEIDGETELVEPYSPAKLSNDNKNGESSPNSIQRKMLNINSNKDEFMKIIIEDSGQHDIRKLDNELEPCGVRLESFSGLAEEDNQGIAEKDNHGDELESTIVSGRGKASTEVSLGIGVGTVLLETDPYAKLLENDKRGGIYQNKQLQSRDQNSCDHGPIKTSIEDSKWFDFISHANEEILRKSEKYASNDSVCLASSSKVSELKLNKEQKKVNQAVKWQKGYTFTSKVMELSSSAGDFIKSKHKTKSRPVMLTQALRDYSQKRNGQNNVSITSTMKTDDRVLCSKHASGASHGSQQEVHSKLTTLRPFSFATGKQGVSSTSVWPRSNMKNILSSSPLPERNIYSKGVSNRLGVSYNQRRDKLESRRGREELGNNSCSIDRQALHLKGRSASNVIRPLKARPINLPTCLGGDPDIGTKSEMLVRNNVDDKLKPVKMMASSKIRDPTLNTKKLRGGDSLNLRKLGKEKPRWR